MPGPRKLVAQWRSPDGAVTSSSTIDYVAKDRRFGAYWPLYLSSTIALGTWSVEATVDGQPAGRYTFEIRDERVESAAPAVVPTPLSPTELYDRLNRAFVVIERSGPGGKALNPMGGFALPGGRVYTSVAALDAAQTLYFVGLDEARREVSSVHAWNRKYDWAILVASEAAAGPMEIAAADSAKIGDRVFTVDGSAGGGRILRDGTISGQLDTAATGRRLIASFVDGVGSAGAPVVNEFGALIGMLSAPPVAGANRLLDLLRVRADLRGHPIVPFFLVRPPVAAVAQTIAELRAKGELVLPLEREENVVSGGFARGITKSPPSPTGQRDDFSLSDKQFIVFVNWSPQLRMRGQTRLHLYDAANQLVLQSPPKKSDLRKNEFALSFWELPIPSAAGHYRVDVLFDETPLWRGFVRITP